MPIPIDTRAAADLSPRLDEAPTLVVNEFDGLDSDRQYRNAFARVPKPGPLQRVPMLGTDQRDLFVPAVRRWSRRPCRRAATCSTSAAATARRSRCSRTGSLNARAFRARTERRLRGRLPAPRPHASAPRRGFRHGDGIRPGRRLRAASTVRRQRRPRPGGAHALLPRRPPRGPRAHGAVPETRGRALRGRGRRDARLHGPVAGRVPGPRRRGVRVRHRSPAEPPLRAHPRGYHRHVGHRGVRRCRGHGQVRRRRGPPAPDTRSRRPAHRGRRSAQGHVERRAAQYLAILRRADL